jgi:hypothetical protein
MKSTEQQEAAFRAKIGTRGATAQPRRAAPDSEEARERVSTSPTPTFTEAEIAQRVRANEWDMVYRVATTPSVPTKGFRVVWLAPAVTD